MGDDEQPWTGINWYDTQLKRLAQAQHDNEASHVIQDRVYRRFVTDVAAGKLGAAAQVSMVAEVLRKKVVRNDRGRWYA